MRKMKGRKLSTIESREFVVAGCAVTWTWCWVSSGISWSSWTGTGICDSNFVPSLSSPVTAPFASIETDFTWSWTTRVLKVEYDNVVTFSAGMNGRRRGAGGAGFRSCGPPGRAAPVRWIHPSRITSLRWGATRPRPPTLPRRRGSGLRRALQHEEADGPERAPDTQEHLPQIHAIVDLD